MVQFAETGMLGYRIKDSNIRLRFFVIIFMGILAFGAVLFWKSQLLFVAEYQEFPITHYQVETRKQNLFKQIEFQNKMMRDSKEMEKYN
ncbi:MAG: hypothetical protein COT92_00945 [Candidatus Doudnabacteria bacterium CG10_big_fil_rev_8_21_14_0_10_42_18]|uniref:Uncharacterized protein n=1 Tax=Candidatus Doudnabacteria bacterium CG10_big_fil_rev_8_21_14_0_10_42_18 TaxID=1974552 RepID=A0A2H0VBL8_9BACT|nr:MAG: hypothetical protein COT92_00945 [Candidatus Doudnabacteria bacterium CG10_big_fil_rev_8_21_14_0_10_42_18]